LNQTGSGVFASLRSGAFDHSGASIRRGVEVAKVRFNIALLFPRQPFAANRYEGRGPVCAE
jgi:hypothetical protein